MKIHRALFVPLIAAGCGVMLMDGNARTICTYALAGVSAVVLATGLAD